MQTPINILFVTNLCAHYRVRTFEAIARLGKARFIFFSDGREGYWESANQLHSGNFEHRYLPGFYLGSHFRIAPGLIWELLRTDAPVIVLGITGRFTIPVTYFLTRLRRKKLILWTGLWYHPESFFHRLTRPLTDALYRHSDAIIAYGEHVKRYLVSRGCDPQKIFMFWQCVNIEKMGRAPNPEKTAAWRNRWSPDGSPIILNVGRFEPEKGLHTLIEAFSMLPRETRARLVLVGRGAEKSRLQEFARAMGVDVAFEDYIANENLPEVYAAASVFCLPSESLPMVKEPWGLVLNEAMLQGCVPVASDSVGAAVGGLFFDEIESLVFPEKNAKALSACLLSALELAKKSELRERIRQRARLFTPERQAEGLESAYRFVMAEPSERRLQRT